MTAFEETLDRFRLAVAGPAESVPVVRAALLVAQAEYPGLDVIDYERQIAGLGERLEARIHPSADVRSQITELHRLLFADYWFRGNEEEYGDARNLYLNEVIDRRLGIPVTLAIVYTALCARAAMRASIIGLPGHVITRIDGAEGAILTDPYRGGAELTEEECRRLVRDVYGRRSPFREHFLNAITPRQVIQRLIHNLKAGYLQQGDEERAARMMELLLAMYPWDLDEVRDRGMLRERIGDYPLALEDLEIYVRYRSDARDIQTVTEAVRSLRRHTGAPDR